MINSEKIKFINSEGLSLDGIIETPDSTEPVGYALYAHCFTCTKAISAAVKISRALAKKNIATLRFDFAGIGKSEGDFSATTFSSNVTDIHSAVGFLRENYSAPKLIIGHSLGGSAVLGAAGDIPEIAAVASIAAPSAPDHVKHLFESKLDMIIADGEACVDLAGRKFMISKAFIDDIVNYKLAEKISKLGKALLIMHSPTDVTVGIENAQELYQAAKHPKSFVSLDDADHLLTDSEDAEYAASIISAWAERYTR